MIYVYHGFRGLPYEDLNHNCRTDEDFKRDLKTIHPLQDMVMFDDCRRSCYEIGFPIMEKTERTGFLGIATGLIDLDESFMNWEEVTEMLSQGWFPVAHSVTHALLTELPKDEIRNQVCQSKKMIERQTGYSVNYFTAPWHKFNKTIEQIVVDAGMNLLKDFIVVGRDYVFYDIAS